MLDYRSVTIEFLIDFIDVYDGPARKSVPGFCFVATARASAFPWFGYVYQMRRALKD